MKLKNFLIPSKLLPVKSNKKYLKRSRFSFQTLKKWTIYTVAAIFLIIITLFAWYSKDLPTPGKIKARQIAESTKIYDRNGNLLYDIFGKQKRTSIKYSQMPQDMKDAVVAVEDKNFYRHHGVDFRGVFRAALHTLTGKRLEGGSTITQQFVKNALLSPERTIPRKIKEVILSLEIEALYSKQQILEFYLNEIPYGSNTYGIEAAANTFFGKKAHDLTLAESAVLASLPQAPTFYSPYGNHTDLLMERKNFVLNSMYKQKYISKVELDAAKIQEIKFVPRRENIIAPHFVFYVRELLAEKYGDRLVEEGGLKVVTSLDLDKQKLAEKIVADTPNLARYGASNAALVAIDPKTGDILSMVGSRDYFDIENDGNVNVAIAKRQPGSSFKPVVYATAFKGKWSPGSTLWDLKTNFGNYSPNNYDGSTHGPLSIRQALANSLNIPAVKTLSLAGLDNSIRTAKDMGITTFTDPDRYGLSLVLGGGEVKLSELTGAYSVFANGGKKVGVNPILKVEDSRGKILEQKKNPKGRQVLKPEIAYEITSILTDNQARSMIFGSRTPLYIPGYSVAAKTGTTDGYRDAWTIGYTPSIAVGVWAGNNDNSSMRRGADGVFVAAPIWNRFMTAMVKEYGRESFVKPRGLRTVSVDKLSGKLPDQSTDTRSDLYASWQIPTEKGGTVKLKICSIVNKIATDACPPTKIVEKVYSDVHSERPDNPSWEVPVRNWLKKHGIDNLPPSENDKEALAAVAPKISFSSPQDGDSVSGGYLIKMNTSTTYGANRVEFYVDDVSIGTDYGSPFQIGYDFNQLAKTSHKLTARIVDNQDLTASKNITINVTSDNDSPGSVSGVSVSDQGNSNNQLSLSWINPDDWDLDKIYIYYSTSGSRPGSPQAIISAVNQSTSIGSLSNGFGYYFWIRPVDSAGNENGSEIRYGPYLP